MNDIGAKFADLTGDSFAGHATLRQLVLDRNDFSDVTEDEFGHVFARLPLLSLLSLQETGLCEVSAAMFDSLTELHTLDLSNNKLSHLPHGAFDSLLALRRLFLSKNKLHTISPLTFSDTWRRQIEVLRLDRNPFQCSCDLLWFRAWLVASPALFYGGYYECQDCVVAEFSHYLVRVDKYPSVHYKCHHSHEGVAGFLMPQQACLLSQALSGYIIFLCSVFALSLASGLLLLRYRWHLRLLLYEAFRGRDDGARQRRLAQSHFDFDVFVSYAADNSSWVRQRLVPELEGGLGLGLCIHERDFIQGNNIVDNIAECVERSKKIMIVFSRDFVRSQWCQFELSYCLLHVMDYDDSLLIVCVDDVVSTKMTTAMMAVLKTTTYLQWAEHPDTIHSFWGRVRLALHEIHDLEHRV
jgi:hypothetical protein